MIDRKLQPLDDFWNVASQEKRSKDSYQRQIDQLKRVIDLGKQTMVLRSQPGFKEFMTAIEGLSQVAQGQLVACVSSNEHMRILQGKTQALNDILALLKNTEKTIEGLEGQLQAVQNERTAAVTTDGKVITTPIGVST